LFCELSLENHYTTRKIAASEGMAALAEWNKENNAVSFSSVEEDDIPYYMTYKIFNSYIYKDYFFHYEWQVTFVTKNKHLSNL
jgi:hypothetical protein